MRNHLKRQRKKTKMEYKQYNLEELYNMFDKEQKPKELNKIMGAIADNQNVSSDDYEETNNIQLEEEIYQQMNLIRLEDLNAISLDEIRKKLDKKKYGKKVFEDEINEIGEELNTDEIESNLVNNVVPEPKEFGEPSRKNTHFMRPMYVPVGCTTNFSFGFIPKKTMTCKEISLTSISQT